MHIRFFVTVAVFLSATMNPYLGAAEDDAHDRIDHKSVKSVENLSPQLRELLRQEMRALQEGMIAVIPAYSSGDLPEVAKIATKMKDSYILKQTITREQMHELHMSLPGSFLKMDDQFHYYAGMLAHVSEARKLELVNFYFAKLTESCAGCHSEHATHRFPAFSTRDAHHEADDAHDH